MKGGGYLRRHLAAFTSVLNKLSAYHIGIGAYLVKILKAIIDWLKQPTEYEYEDEIEVLFGKKSQDE